MYGVKRKKYVLRGKEIENDKYIEYITIFNSIMQKLEYTI